MSDAARLVAGSLPAPPLLPSQAVRVPPALMDDIVRPLWDYRVVVSGWREGRKIVLDDIRRDEDVDE